MSTLGVGTAYSRHALEIIAACRKALAQLLDTLDAMRPEADADYWRDALAACKEVDITAIAVAGVSGREVGERLRAERVKRLG